MPEIAKAYKNYLDSCGEGLFIPTQARIVAGGSLMKLSFDSNSNKENVRGLRKVSLRANLPYERGFELFKSIYERFYGDEPEAKKITHFSQDELFRTPIKKVGSLDELDASTEGRGIPLYLWAEKVHDSPLRMSPGTYSSDRSVEHHIIGSSGTVLEKVEILETALALYAERMQDQ